MNHANEQNDDGRTAAGQVAGGAGFSTSLQARPAKLLFVAYTAQQ